MEKIQKAIHREEKSLRHVAMVAKFWMTKNPKIHLTRRLKSFPWDALVYRSIMAFYLNLEKLGKPERCVML